MKTNARITYPDIELDDVRAYAAEQANLSSLRILAPQIPLGHSTLHSFLQGADPHPRVRDTLCRWYLRARGRNPEALDAVEKLLVPFQGEARASAKGALLETLRRCYANAALETPGWIWAAQAELNGSS